jgi:hypothetical protein
LLRTESDPALRYWVAGWCSAAVFVVLYTAQNLLRLEHPAILYGPVSFFTTAMPLFFLAGNFAFVGRPLPRWLPPLFLAACLLRGGVTAAGGYELTHLLVYPIEVTASLVGAFLILRAAPTLGRRAAPIALAVTYLASGVWEGATAYLSLIGAQNLESRLVGWGAAGLVAIVQLLAILSRVRDREDAAQQSRERSRHPSSNRPAGASAARHREPRRVGTRDLAAQTRSRPGGRVAAR